MPLRYRIPLGLLIALLGSPLWAAQKVNLDYHVRLMPQTGQADVRLTLAEGSAVRSLDFDLGAPAATAISRPMAAGSSPPTRSTAVGCGIPRQAPPR
jgi:hypothetical protein